MKNTSGIIGGADPLEYASSSPYTVFFFQVIVIMVFSQCLHFFFGKIRQPRVIAEVFSGILLGHTALGRIPNFTKYVFPSDSIQGLTLVANIGICLLLFMVGCEVDVKFIKKNIVIALTVGVFNMAVPFGLGCALSIGLWKEYREGVAGLPDIHFTTFMVFIAVAMCITAFPVLARILTELRLVKYRVGIIVLAAGVTNDMIGWVLLALSITLANSSKSEITAYIVLTAIGWCLFILYPVKIALHYVLRNWLKDFENPNGPSRLAMLIILVMLFASAFFTDIIGVHPIFGAFLIGIIVPRNNNYVIKITSRIEDLVNIVFLPIYFTIVGLNVDLGLLNRGRDWGWSIALIVIAMVGKIFGGLVAAKAHGLFWRESLTVGVLMSCKGIVEIVVLQTGLNAQIISQKTYSMFIFMALITTFLTTPLTLLCYPESYRDEVQNLINVTGNKKADPKIKESINNYNDIKFDKLVLSVESLTSVSSSLVLLEMLIDKTNMGIHAINIKTLTERTSDLLHASMLQESKSDIDYNSLNSILSIIKIFSHTKKLSFTSEIQYCVPQTKYQSILESSSLDSSSLLVVTMDTPEYSIESYNDLSKELEVSEVPKVLFINNPERNTDESSLHIRSVVVIINNKELDKPDMVSLKLLSCFMNHEDIKMANVVLEHINSDDPEFKLIKSEVDRLNDERSEEIVQIIIRDQKDENSLKDYISTWESAITHNDQLTLVNHAEREVIDELVSRDEKVLVVF